VLSQDEVLRLLKAESNLKMRTADTDIYAAGLRVSEVVAYFGFGAAVTGFVFIVMDEDSRKSP